MSITLGPDTKAEACEAFRAIVKAFLAQKMAHNDLTALLGFIDWLKAQPQDIQVSCAVEANGPTGELGFNIRASVGPMPIILAQ